MDLRAFLSVFCKRLLPAFLILALGIRILLGTANIVWMLIALLCFLIAAIFVSGPVAQWLSAPLGSLFWPRRYYDKPQPMYGIPQSLRKKGRLEDALAEYEKIAAAHPNEVRPWLEMIAIAIEDMKNPERAEAYFARGVAALNNPDDRDLLAKTFAEIRTRLDPRPPHPPIALPHSGR